MLQKSRVCPLCVDKADVRVFFLATAAHSNEAEMSAIEESELENATVLQPK